MYQNNRNSSPGWTTAISIKTANGLSSLGWVLNFLFYSLLNIGSKHVDMGEQTRVKGRLALITGASGGYEIMCSTFNGVSRLMIPLTVLAGHALAS
jgi:hypothetical protein